MYPPARRSFTAVLCASLVISVAWGYSSDLSPAPSTDERVPGIYDEQSDEVLSYAANANEKQSVTEDEETAVVESMAPMATSQDIVADVESPNVQHDEAEVTSPSLEPENVDDSEGTEPEPQYEDYDYTVLENIVKIAETAVHFEKNNSRGLMYYRLAGALGHSGALTAAAALLLSGENGLQRDVSGAVRMLDLAVDAGQADAQSLLGTLHATGLADRYGVQKSAARALVHWRFAAESGNVFAATALGFRYKMGIDVPADCQTAARYYSQAAKSIATDPATWPSVRNFVNMQPPLPPKLRSFETSRLQENVVDRLPEAIDGEDDILYYYRHTAGRGNVEALTTLGALHLFGGQGLARNEPRALEILNRAANRDAPDAHAILAHVDMRRNGDKDSIINHFDKAAAKGNRHGHYALGMIYFHGLFEKEKDHEKAFNHFKEAVELQHPAATFLLGSMYWRGQGTKKNKGLAFATFQHGARLGNVQSEYQVATILLQGLPPVGQPDCNLALKHFKNVAEKGDWKSIFEAGMNAFDGNDDFGALYRFMQAAHAGIELGQYNAGILLERRSAGDISELAHWPRERLIDEATELYHMSARQDHSEALVRAGNMAFFEKKDYTSAVEAYKDGTALKNAEAMFSLGWMYVRGLGVPQDRHLALRYLNLAKSTRTEALVPVTVALLFLRAYWNMWDIAQSLGVDTYISEQLEHLKPAAESAMSEMEVMLRSRNLSAIPVSSDSLMVGVLLLALLLVVMLRQWRLDMVNAENEEDYIDIGDNN